MTVKNAGDIDRAENRRTDQPSDDGNRQLTFLSRAAGSPAGLRLTDAGNCLIDGWLDARLSASPMVIPLNAASTVSLRVRSIRSIWFWPAPNVMSATDDSGRRQPECRARLPRSAHDYVSHLPRFRPLETGSASNEAPGSADAGSTLFMKFDRPAGAAGRPTHCGPHAGFY